MKRVPLLRFIWKPAFRHPPKNDIYLVRDQVGQMAFATWEREWRMDHRAGFSEDQIIAWWPLPPMDTIATK